MGVQLAACNVRLCFWRGLAAHRADPESTWKRMFVLRSKKHTSPVTLVSLGAGRVLSKKTGGFPAACSQDVIFVVIPAIPCPGVRSRSCRTTARDSEGLLWLKSRGCWRRSRVSLVCWDSAKRMADNSSTSGDGRIGGR